MAEKDDNIVELKNSGQTNIACKEDETKQATAGTGYSMKVDPTASFSRHSPVPKRDVTRDASESSKLGNSPRRTRASASVLDFRRGTEEDVRGQMSSPMTPATAFFANVRGESAGNAARRRSSAASSIARRLSTSRSSAGSITSAGTSMKMSTSRELPTRKLSGHLDVSTLQGRRNSRGAFVRNKSSAADITSMNSNSRSSLSSNISNVVGMFSRASMRIRNSVTDRDNTLRSIQAAQNAHKDRMDQARREKMRDQGTEESPYLDDAHSLENKPLDLQDEEHLQTQLKHICFWAWLGGKEVQDVLVSGGIFGKILDILQARLSNPLYEGSSEPSHHGFMSYVGSTLGLSQMVAVHQQGTKISSKGCVAALRAVATVCRDHLRNQSLAQQSGIVITLVEIIAHSRITVVEKKWAIHAMNAAILTNAAAQDMVLGCAKADELRSFCSHHFTDAEWTSWPNNEVACLMHILDWKP